MLYHAIMDKFAALADPTRRKILELLAEQGQLPASSIYQHFDSSPPAVSQHLKILRQAELVQVTKQAQKRIYEVNVQSLKEFEAWANRTIQLWSNRFDRLDKLLQELEESE